MKKLILLLLIVLPLSATPQSSIPSGEVVSQRIANAINSGKFYMKVSGMVTEMDEGKSIQTFITLSIAAKDRVIMTRVEGFDIPTINANGYSYQLDEANKTYMASKPQADEPDLEFGKLTFHSQGTCILNGTKYYYDQWKSSIGFTFTFYYNTARVAAIDFGMGEKGLGLMSLLSFDIRIPGNMYFCIPDTWILNDPTHVDISQYVDLDDIKVEGLPEGMNVKDLVSGKVDQKSLLKDLLKDEDLPEGMNINDVMGMVDGAMSKNNTKQALSNLVQDEQKNKAEMRKMLKNQGMTDAQIEHTLKEYYPNTQLLGETLEGMNQQEARAIEAANAPPPPTCNTPWSDSAATCELAAGISLGTINISNQVALSPYVYLAQFDEPEAVPQVNLSMDVTDEGIWKAFDQFAEETKNMTSEEATEYIMNHSNDAVLCAEFGYVTGEVIERAVVTCMLCPSSVTYNNAGLLFFYKGDTENALQYYQKAEEMDKDNAIILLNIAECFFQLKDYAAARRYADRSASLEPEYGLAFQLLTSINLAEGNHILAAETLFKCAATYFSDVTATQFFSLEMMLRSAPAKICDGFNMKALFDQVFSPKNLDLLTQATRAGFTSNGQDIPANQKTFAWPMVNGIIQTTYMSLAAKLKEYQANQDALQQRSDALGDKNPWIYAYPAMGMQDIQSDLVNMEEMANSISSIPIKINIPKVPDLQTYAMISDMIKQGASGSFLPEARQYWCLQMWKIYYELLYDYSAGSWACYDNAGNMKGYYPASFAQFENRKKEIEKNHEDDFKIYAGWIKPCLDAYNECMKTAETERQIWQCYVNQILCILPHNKRYVQTLYGGLLIQQLDAEKDFYTSTVQPVLEEYWLRMNAMTGYCNDLAVQEYILNDVMSYINWRWQTHMNDGKIRGELIDLQWATMVLKLEEEIEVALSVLEQMPVDPPKPIETKDVRLANYGEKKTFDIEAGFTTPLGRLSLSRQDNQYSVGFANAATGKTSVRNLTTGENTSMTTYESLADKPGSQDPKGYLRTLGEWGAQKGLSKMVNTVGKAATGKDEITNFQPFNDTATSRQRMRTVDSQGNITDSGIVHFRERSVGVGDYGVGLGQTQIRTGNSIRTKNHVRMKFNLFDVKLSK